MKEVQRFGVFGPVPASVRVNKDAKKSFFKSDKGIAVSYFTCWKAVPGGFMELFVFGEAKPGQEVSAMVELKTKQSTTGQQVHYLRAEVAKCKPAHKLYTGNPDDENVKIDPAMPSAKIQESGRRALVGFVPIGK